MAYSNISAALTVAQKASIKANIDAIKTILIFLVNLTPQERMKLRKTGNVRFGYVNDVYKAAVANPTTLPAGFNITEFGKDMQLLSDLTDIMGWLRTLNEGMDDTLMALGSEVIHQSDEVYGMLKVQAAKSSD
ncbi:MAG: hypothetical protein V2A54_06230, partial [Bacteroidota bacterium]